MKKSVFILFIFFILFVSCKENNLELVNDTVSKDFDKNWIDESVTGSYEIKDGLVTFKSIAELDKVMVNSKAFFSSFEKDNPTFLSLLRKYVKLSNEFYQTTDKKKKESIVYEHFSLVQTDKNNLLTLKILSPYSKILNSEGAYRVGKMIHVFLKNQQVIIQDNDLKKIPLVSDENYVNKAVIRINNAVKLANLKTTSCFQMGASNGQISLFTYPMFTFESLSNGNFRARAFSITTTSGSTGIFPYVSCGATAKVIVNGVVRGQAQVGFGEYGNPYENFFISTQITTLFKEITPSERNNIPADIVYENASGVFENDLGSQVSYNCQ